MSSIHEVSDFARHIVSNRKFTATIANSRVFRFEVSSSRIVNPEEEARLKLVLIHGALDRPKLFICHLVSYPEPLAKMPRFEAVSFPTLDGLTLRGNLYSASQPGLGIILLPGFSFVKEIMLPKVAQYFQKSGVTALAYDPRTLGESDGSPRRDIDPTKHVSDLHDALTFLQKHPMVNPGQIAFWGFSFNGIVALNAAALDRRAKCVIAVTPLMDMSYPTEHLGVLLCDAMRDREAQLAGAEPAYLPVIQKDGTCPYGWGQGTSTNEYRITEKSASLFPTYKNEMTVQTHYRISTWRPYDLIPQVAPTPVMIVTPVEDRMSPMEKQKALFDSLTTPKRHLLVPNKGHMDVLTGRGFETIMNDQLKFLRHHIEQQPSIKPTL